MDPKTGAIIAMAARPDYFPGDIHNYPTQYFPNPIINQSYEPGSTFKIVIMSAAINEDLVDYQTICPCQGPVAVPPYVISTWDYQYHPNSNITEIIQYSDNTGMVYISKLFEPETFIKYIKDFGFGQQTHVDLEEEDFPPLRELWRDIDIATASFGQGIAVTPLQMLTAAAAIANNGLLMQPQVVDKIVINSPLERGSSALLNRGVLSSQENTQTIDIPPKSIKQVITLQTAQHMTDIMVNAVKHGEAQWTQAKGYDIAGKTGTSEIPLAGKYEQEKTIASFIGFAPADDPKFVMLVTLNEPETSPWGSETAAPLWFDIAKQLFLHWNIPPDSSV
jgi:cell division protein FtsI/penicillin-binding protein 2